MSTRVPIDLERVAEALADSAALDWAALERGRPDLAETLARLRALERLAAAHREAGAERGADAAGTATAWTWGPLEVRERLGEGAFGEVFRAHDRSLGRDVALKLRRATAVGPASAWLAEARRLARVSHPHVLAVLGVDEHEGRAGLWTELVHGETLEARLAREGPLPAREVALLGVDLCRALAAVHAEQLVHGDLKTTNVMCERGPLARHPGRVVLMDFGAGQEGPPASPATWTPLVSAPELLEGGNASAATDQYALGVLLYRLLTARWPFEAEDVATLLERAARASPPLRELRPDVPPALHDAVLRSLARTPRERHANLSELERALAASIAAPDETQRARRTAMIAGLVALAAIVLVGAAVLARWPRGAPARAPADASAGVSGGAGGSTPAVRPLELSASLLRRTSAGSEPLVDGGVVRAGDRLALELRSAEPVWIYVFDEDASGAAFTLFPLADLELRNPLPAGVNHRLPGALHGRDFAWQVGEGGGSETFLVVASRAARPGIESLAQRLAQAGGTGGAVGAASGGASPPGTVRRGVEGLVEETATRSIEGPVTRLARDLSSARDPDLWLWRVRATHAVP